MHTQLCQFLHKGQFLHLTRQFLIRFSRLGVFSRICRNSWVSSVKEAQGHQVWEACITRQGLEDVLISVLPSKRRSSLRTNSTASSYKTHPTLFFLLFISMLKTLVRKSLRRYQVLFTVHGNVFDLAPNLPSKSSRVTVPSTYSHQCFPSVETGISQLDHLQAKWMQTQATTGGVYCRLKVVRWRLTSPAGREKQKAVSSQAWTAAAHTTARWTDTARSEHPSALKFSWSCMFKSVLLKLFCFSLFQRGFPGAPVSLELQDPHMTQTNMGKNAACCSNAKQGA